MKKRITASFLLWALVSCSNAAQRSPTVVSTFEVLPTAAPTEGGAPSEMPTFEEAASPEPGKILKPQGTPLQEWRGIPIMPEALAGQEFSEDNSYSFSANVTPTQVQDFYSRKLTELGWNQPFGNTLDADGGSMTFRITILLFQKPAFHPPWS